MAAAALVVTDDKTGDVVEPGATLTDFRGDTAILIYATRARSDGRSGKVYVEWPGGDKFEYYDGVFNVTVAAA